MSTFEKTNETFPLFFWTQTEGSQTTQCTIETPVKDMIEMHFDFFKRPKKGLSEFMKFLFSLFLPNIDLKIAQVDKI